MMRFILTFLSLCCFVATTLAASTDHFVTTWKTNNIGFSNETSILIPIKGGPYDVDWDNDEQFEETGLNGPVTHDFDVAKTYTIRIQGNFDSIQFADGGDKLKIISIDQWGTNSWVSMAQAFEGAKNLEIPASDTPDFSSVTSFNRAFMNAQQANPNTSNWNTGAARSMSYMFFAAKSANPDTSNWDTSNVQSMYSMFNGAEVATPDTSKWDTSEVVETTFMFYNARSANPNTSNWNVSSVVKMGSMFANAFAANPDTSSWNTSKVRDMKLMFFGAISANPDVSNWDTSSVVDMHWMFWEASQANPDVSNWDTSNVTNMQKMFNEATSFNRNIGIWNVISLTEATGMLDGVALSIENYENLLIGWNAQSIQPGVSFSGGNSTYCSAEAAEARANMITSDGWVITDGGQVCDLIFADGFESGKCPDPDGMALFVTAESTFCVDIYEASRQDATIASAGSDESMATSRRAVLPWSSIGLANARTACGNAGKRLCTTAEWVESCGGPNQLLYPYHAVDYDPEACNGVDAGFGTAGLTGSRILCTSPGGINDMSGNLEEWVEEGFTRGGSYEDGDITLRCLNDGESPSVDIPGISVGFRCCADPLY